MSLKKIVICAVLLILCFCITGCNQTGESLSIKDSENENVSLYTTNSDTETQSDNLTHNNYSDSSIAQGGKSNDNSSISSVISDTSKENYSSEQVENSSNDDIVPPKVTDNGEIELPNDIWS